MDFEEKTINRQTVFDGQIIKVAVDDVELPNGLGQSKRELVFHGGAVATLAVTPEHKIDSIVRLLKVFLTKFQQGNLRRVSQVLRKKLPFGN